MTDTTLPREKIDEIQRAAMQIAPADSNLDNLYQRYEEIYFMTAREKVKGGHIDDKDQKITVSPNGRNAVVGMKRLLDTSEVHISIKQKGEKSQYSDAIEKGLLCILHQSGMYRRARVEKDLNLSTVLYGPAILAAESVDDLILQQKKDGKGMAKAYIKRLEKIKRYTPFLLRAINPRHSFSRWGEFGMIAHLRKYKLKGDAVMERWGIPNLDKMMDYWVWDYIDMENRVAWLEQKKDQPLIAKPHLMPTMNITARFAGGSSLFDEDDRQMQSFLYAHVKGEWDRRENMFWTYLFTALYMQGLPGPLVMIDPDGVTPNQPVEVNFANGIRYIVGKGQVTDWNIIDPDVLRIKELMDATSAESTIFKQTLGQNISGSTFSGLAMLSSAGQLPLEDPKEALESVYNDIFEHILCRIKEGGVDNEVLPANWIPDDYEIEVTLEPKLPQDNLRNAQIAASLGDLVSDEYKREKFLQIGDSKAMTKQVMREQLLKGIMGAMMQKPEVVDQIVQRIMGMGQQPANVNTQPPGGPPQPTPDQMMMEGQPSPEEAQLMAQGGMEGMPQTDQMIPPQERM